MSTRRQYAASSGVCDAQRLPFSNFNPGPPISQLSNDGYGTSRNTASGGPTRYEGLPFHMLCHAAADLHYMPNVGYGFEGGCVVLVPICNELTAT